MDSSTYSCVCLNEMTYYDDFENEFCGKCHYSCEFCRGPTEFECETCRSDRDRYPTGKYLKQVSLVKCKCVSNLV
jgi:hypothetical protein